MITELLMLVLKSGILVLFSICLAHGNLYFKQLQKAKFKSF